MSFMTLYGYCDVIQSNIFEGLGPGYNYTLEQMNEINETVLATLVLPLSEPVLSRNMYISKLLRLPLSMMTRYMEAEIFTGKKVPKVKFLSYSEHDWTVAQLLLFFDAQNGQFEVLPFASSVQIELHSTEGCSDEDCFWVEVIYNGQRLSFDGDCEVADRCNYPEFMHMIQFKGFVNTRTHYEHECAKNWSPHTNSMSNLLYRHWKSASYNLYKTREELGLDE